MEEMEDNSKAEKQEIHPTTAMKREELNREQNKCLHITTEHKVLTVNSRQESLSTKLGGKLENVRSGRVPKIVGLQIKLRH